MTPDDLREAARHAARIAEAAVVAEREARMRWHDARAALTRAERARDDAWARVRAAERGATGREE